MAFWSWSRTAATNATADSSINWAEGQSPSSVNDSSRGMMAALASYRDDTAGAIASGGTSTAYTVASYESFDTRAHMAGQIIAFTPHATNGATVTLNVDGLGALPLRSAPSVEIGAGVLVQGTPYIALYNNTTTEFLLQAFYGNALTVPLGGLIDYVGTTAPNANFVLPYGQAISRTTYATLFSLVATTFGGGDGLTTFNILDLRGRVVAGKDDMGGSAASRIGSVVTDSATIVGTTLGSVGGSSTHIQTTAEMAAHGHAATVTDPGHFHTIGSAPSNATGGIFNQGPTAAQNTSVNTDTKTTGITVSNASGGGSNAMAIMQPTMILTKILRVL